MSPPPPPAPPSRHTGGHRALMAAGRRISRERRRALHRPKRAGHTPELSSAHGGSLRRLPLGQQWDEMFGEPGRARSPYAGLFASLQPIDGEELSARADLLSQTYRDAGVTFAHAGEEQPFPLDIVPRVIGAEEWAVIE